MSIESGLCHLIDYLLHGCDGRLPFARLSCICKSLVKLAFRELITLCSMPLHVGACSRIYSRCAVPPDVPAIRGPRLLFRLPQEPYFSIRFLMNRYQAGLFRLISPPHPSASSRNTFLSPQLSDPPSRPQRPLQPPRQTRPTTPHSCRTPAESPPTPSFSD